MYHIKYSCLSHVGKRRSMNQDNFICEGLHMDPSDPAVLTTFTGSTDTGSKPLFGIFDGMGGEQAGEQAAFIAAQTAAEFKPGSNLVADLLALCQTANAGIVRYLRSHGISTMGTTAAMLCFGGRDVTLCNIGDSKIFSFFRGELKQLSVDHVCAAGRGGKAPLSQSLGVPPEEFIIEPFAENMPCRIGELFLICSDGLTDMVPTDSIRRTLQSVPFDEAGRKLLDMALDAGGKDNCTIMLLQVGRASLL